MTVKECYEQMGADYEGVLGRLRSEVLIKKFAKKFLDDGSFRSLKDNLVQKNGEEAFRAAHTLKGVCQNLGFDNLYKASFDITEKLRGRDTEGCEELLARVEEQYNNTVAAGFYVCVGGYWRTLSCESEYHSREKSPGCSAHYESGAGSRLDERKISVG